MNLGILTVAKAKSLSEPGLYRASGCGKLRVEASVAGPRLRRVCSVTRGRCEIVRFLSSDQLGEMMNRMQLETESCGGHDSQFQFRAELG